MRLMRLHLACASIAAAVAVAAATTALVACGARTPLGLASAPSDASPADDAAPASPLDASASDAPMDASAPCADGRPPTEEAYVLDAMGHLYRYAPQTGQAQDLGAPSCANGNVQWTLTASSEKAFIVYTDWTLYEVSLTTLACTPTPLQPADIGLQGEFGVALAGSGASERLYFYGLTGQSQDPVLAVADTSTFAPKIVGAVLPAPSPSTFPVNLAYDGAGHLVAYSPGGFVLQIDPATGAVLQQVDSGVTSPSTWATLAYGPRLFLWASTRVAGYDLTAESITSDRDAGILAVGAGSFLACPR